MVNDRGRTGGSATVPRLRRYTPAGAPAYGDLGVPRRISCLFQYVSERHNHSAGPKQYRCSQTGLHASWRAQIATTTTNCPA